MQDTSSSQRMLSISTQETIYLLNTTQEKILDSYLRTDGPSNIRKRSETELPYSVATPQGTISAPFASPSTLQTRPEPQVAPPVTKLMAHVANIEVEKPEIKLALGSLTAIAEDSSLTDESNVLDRVDALAYVIHVREQILDKLATGNSEPEVLLRQLADIQFKKLSAINEQHFWCIKFLLKQGGYTPQELRSVFNNFTAYKPGSTDKSHKGYDYLDVLMNRLFSLNSAPEPQHRATEETYGLEVTPARVVLDMIDRIGFRPTDVFYDIGCGLGQIPILINLLCGIRTVGIELEPVYQRFAKDLAKQYQLDKVDFHNVDAREAAFTYGTVFYLFTPFSDSVLAVVLNKLKSHAQSQPIQIATLGDCTAFLYQQEWLSILDESMNDPFRLAIFRSKSI